MASETTNSEDKFREELSWCIEYLELKLPNVGEKQAKDISKGISSLKNSKNPLPKKRQLMRVLCGNYREKMTQEDQNFKLTTNMKISSKSKPLKKAVVLRRHPKSYQKSKLLSSDQPTTSTQTLSSMMKSMKVDLTENKKEETFKFNFNVEDNQESKTEIESETKVKSEPEEKFKFVKSDNSFRFNF